MTFGCLFLRITFEVAFDKTSKTFEIIFEITFEVTFC